MACPHHPDKAYVVRDGKLVCPECGYQVDIPHRVLSHEEALRRLEISERTAKKYAELLERVVDYCSAKDELQEFILDETKR